jgi:phage shock protein A
MVVMNMQPDGAGLLGRPGCLVRWVGRRRATYAAQGAVRDLVVTHQRGVLQRQRLPGLACRHYRPWSAPDGGQRKEDANMGAFGRIGRVIRANFNGLVDRLENPERLVEQIVRDTNEALRKARVEVHRSVAEEQIMESNLQRARALERQWALKAELAVAQGRDDLAREALRRKSAYPVYAQIYERQLSAQRHAVARLQAGLQALEEKYEALLPQRDILLAQYKTAKAQERVGEVARSMSTMDPSSDLARMEVKIRYQEARAQAQVELGRLALDAEFTELERDDRVGVEWSRLRHRIGQAA